MTPPALFQPFARQLLSIPPRFLLLFVVWTLVWKGLALWRAARAGRSAWFVVLLVVNTGGILEIIYLAFFSPRRSSLAGAVESGSSASPPAEHNR